MTSEDRVGQRGRPIGDLDELEQRRTAADAHRVRLRERLSAAFAGYPPGAPDVAQARDVRRFLAFTLDHVDDFGTRVTVQHPVTREVVVEDWGVLCGGSIRALEVPPRIRRLVLDAVLGLLPGGEQHPREALALAAGMDVTAHATTADLAAVRRRGMLGAFGAKLLVDTKRLIAEHTADEAEAYFAAAHRVVAGLATSPYQTGSDRRFLDQVRRRFHGGLEALVEAQRRLTLAEIARRDPTCPELERRLRDLLASPRAPDRGRSLEDWAIAARVAFEAEPYVFARVGELRQAVKARLAELERAPLPDPEVLRKAAAPAVAEAGARLEELLRRHGVMPTASSPSRLEPLELLFSNASLLGRPEVVRDLNAILAETDLVDPLARLEIAAFLLEEPAWRARLHDELVMWDELLRSAPPDAETRAKIDGLYESLLARLRSRGMAPGAVRPVDRSPLSVGRPILAGLRSREGFEIFERWLRGVRALWGGRAPSDDVLADSGLPPLPVPPPAGVHALARTTTSPWHPSLADAKLVPAAPEATEAPEGTGASDAYRFPCLPGGGERPEVTTRDASGALGSNGAPESRECLDATIPAVAGALDSYGAPDRRERPDVTIPAAGGALGSYGVPGRREASEWTIPDTAGAPDSNGAPASNGAPDRREHPEVTIPDGLPLDQRLHPEARRAGFRRRGRGRGNQRGTPRG